MVWRRRHQQPHTHTRGAATSASIADNPIDTTSTTTTRNPDGPLSSPENIAAFIVGNSSQWPYGRDTEGDVALARVLEQEGGLSRVCLVQDAIHPNVVQEQLRAFLQEISACDSCCKTIILYCGGHGLPAGLCVDDGESSSSDSSDDGDDKIADGLDEKDEATATLEYNFELDAGIELLEEEMLKLDVEHADEEKNGTDKEDEYIWKYKDLIQDMESMIPGKNVLILADCCHAGNLAIVLRQHPEPLGCSYLAIMSTLAHEEAGPDWTLTSCIIDAIRGAPQVDVDGDGLISLYDAVAYTTDTIFNVKGDVATVYCHNAGERQGNESFHPKSLFLSKSVVSYVGEAKVVVVDREALETESASSSSTSSSSDSSSESWFQPDAKFLRSPAALTTTFYCWWQGGQVGSNNDQYVYPAWMPAILDNAFEKRKGLRQWRRSLSQHAATVALRATDPSNADLSWNVKAPVDKLWYYVEGSDDSESEE